MRVLVGMEFSGRVRDAFIEAGHDAMSCDFLPSESPGPHHVGDVFDVLRNPQFGAWDIGIFHPPCTYLTGSAEWAYSDGPYHQTLQPGTLVGKARREARDFAVHQFRLLASAYIPMIAIENPIGIMSSRWRKPDQIVHPWWFGDDASKATCLWLKGLPPLKPTDIVLPRWNSHGRPRWGNQTDSGQNRLTPSPDRWKDRSRTYPGLAQAMARQWSP